MKENAPYDSCPSVTFQSDELINPNNPNSRNASVELVINVTMMHSAIAGTMRAHNNSTMRNILSLEKSLTFILNLL